MTPIKMTITRNKIFKFLIWSLTSTAVLTGTSCKKWLEEDPYSLYAAETYFNNTDDAKKATLGVYEIMSDQNTYGFYMSLVYDIDSDLGHMEGVGLSNDNRTLAHYKMAPNHLYLERSWRRLYDGINRANLVIARIPEMNLFTQGTDAEKTELNRCLAEARFLRGLYYFDLVRLFGDVPLKITYTQAEDDMNLSRTDREVVYDQIVKDMNEAIVYIPELSQKAVDERLSKGAAKGVLARVYLGRAGYSLRQNGNRERPANYLDYYTEAARLTKEVIESGEHALNTSYENIFRNYCQLKLEPKESMFEVAFFNPAGEIKNSGVIGTWNSPLADAASPYGRANSFYKVSPVFYKKYATSDKRRDIAIANFQINAAGQTVALTGTADTRWAPGKWRRNWQTTAPKELNYTDINWVLLRYADVLLMHAEAENEVHGAPTASAYEAVNKVRRRGFSVDINTVSALADIPTGLDKEAFFKRLQEERAFELCYEGWRKFDLIRWNILGESLRKAEAELKIHRANFPYIAGTYFEDNKHELYPIPAKDRDINPNLSQNPNY